MNSANNTGTTSNMDKTKQTPLPPKEGSQQDTDSRTAQAAKRDDAVAPVGEELKQSKDESRTSQR